MDSANGDSHHVLDWLLLPEPQDTTGFGLEWLSLILTTLKFLKKPWITAHGYLVLSCWASDRDTDIHACTPSPPPHTYAHLFPGLHRCTWMMSLWALSGIKKWFSSGFTFRAFYWNMVLCGPLNPSVKSHLEHHNPEELRTKKGLGFTARLRVSS